MEYTRRTSSVPVAQRAPVDSIALSWATLSTLVLGQVVRVYYFFLTFLGIVNP